MVQHNTINRIATTPLPKQNEKTLIQDNFAFLKLFSRFPGLPFSRLEYYPAERYEILPGFLEAQLALGNFFMKAIAKENMKKYPG